MTTSATDVDQQEDALDSGRIMEVGFGFMASKVLLSAVELEVFTLLGSSSLAGEELRES